MAKRQSTGREDIREYEGEPGRGSQGGRRGSVAGDAGDVIEFDPEDPTASRQFGLQSAEAEATADTIVPGADLFQARDALQASLGGFRALATALATSAPDTAGKENIIGFGVGLRY